MSKNSLPIFFLVIFLTCFCVAGTGSCANMITPELEAALGSLPPGQEISVIVILSDKADIRPFRDMPRPLRRAGIVKALKNKADLTQRGLKTFLESRRAKEIKSLWLINGMAVTATAGVIRELTVLSGIEEIRPDETIRVPEITYAPLSLSEWNISAIKAPDLWKLGFNGTGVVVANMLDFRYRITDAEKASPFFSPAIKPLIIDEDTGAVMAAPNVPKVDSMRSTRKPLQDRNYFILFANPQKHIKPGHKVTVVIGDYRAEHLVVE